MTHASFFIFVDPIVLLVIINSFCQLFSSFTVDNLLVFFLFPRSHQLCNIGELGTFKALAEPCTLIYLLFSIYALCFVFYDLTYACKLIPSSIYEQMKRWRDQSGW